MGYFRVYCPYCGEIRPNKVSRCPHCFEYINPVETKHEGAYYAQKSIEKYGDKSRWKDIILEEEIIPNPLFDQKKRDFQATEEERKEFLKERAETKARMRGSQESCVPRCPICKSTKLKQVSSLKRYASAFAFGIFSKGAQSQFECQNCKYKF